MRCKLAEKILLSNQIEAGPLSNKDFQDTPEARLKMYSLPRKVIGRWQFSDVVRAKSKQTERVQAIPADNLCFFSTSQDIY